MSLTPFTDSMQHLLAELERLDLRVRAQIARTRAATAADPAFRGLFISEQEVDAVLSKPAGAPRWLQAEPAAAGVGADAADGAPTPWQGWTETHAARSRLSLEQGIDLRLPRLAGLFGLDRFETDALLLATAGDLDLRYERLFGWLQDDVTRKRPGVGLLIDLLCTDAAGRLQARCSFDAQAPLRAGRLIDLPADTERPQPPLLARAVKVDERVVAFLLGSDAPDERLLPLARWTQPAHGVEAGAALPAMASALRSVADRARAGSGGVVHLVGPAGAGHRTAAMAVARGIGCGLLEIDLEQMAAQGDFDATIRLAEREAALQGTPLLGTGFDALLAAPQRAMLERWMERLMGRRGLVLLSGSLPFEPAGRLRGLRFQRLPLPELDTVQRSSLWRSALPGLEDAGIDADVLAGKFKFGPEQLHDAAATVLRAGQERLDGGGAAPKPTSAPAWTADDVHAACRLHSNQQLTRAARKVTPKYRFEDIVLPPDRMTMLRDICNHMKYRAQVYGDWGFGRKLAMGKGLSVLFAGPSGTGKTMAADIIAGELGLDLFKIDLSSVISKYIGETEKNLGSLFDEAETSNAILFFDEADALFGKRTEVRDSHDRYANVEVGYLLQRIEAYEGVAILATNFRKNIDEAFARRLQFTVEFPFPGPADRRSIWQRVWPTETPLHAAIDAEDLGRRFEMTGGNIRNVALAAAFLAADEGGAVQVGHVMRATQREFQKMGKLIDDKSFAAAAV